MSDQAPKFVAPANETLPEAVARLRAYAHQADHYVDVDQGESASHRPEHRFVFRAPQRETTVVFVYSVDLVTEGGEVRQLRHLSIQFSMPGPITQGQANGFTTELHQMAEPYVKLFFPMRDKFRTRVQAFAPVPVVDARKPKGQGNVHFRTPIVTHYVVDQNDTSLLAGSGMAGLVTKGLL